MAMTAAQRYTDFPPGNLEKLLDGDDQGVQRVVLAVAIGDEAADHLDPDGTADEQARGGQELRAGSRRQLAPEGPVGHPDRRHGCRSQDDPGVIEDPACAQHLPERIDRVLVNHGHLVEGEEEHEEAEATPPPKKRQPVPVGAAPSASRTPISCVRWLTKYAITP